MASSFIVDDLVLQTALPLRIPILSFPLSPCPAAAAATSPTMSLTSSTLSLTSQRRPVNQNQLSHVDHRHRDHFNHHSNRLQPSFGICFDVDGVLARGPVAIPEAPRAMRKLLDEGGQLRVPISFVTNSLNRPIDRANQLSEILGIHVAKEQVIQAPCPLSLFKGIQEKFCLVVGQGTILEIASDLGFKRLCTVEDVVAAYPLLDMVDHDNRRRISNFGYEEKPLQKIEAIVLMGEPKRWESALQIIVDLLRTGGQPGEEAEEMTSSADQLPVIACNMDLQFKDRAKIPRFGHGAFLICLEALYKKVTGEDLRYAALVGKPSEITFRFAEDILTKESRRMGYTDPVKTMYLVGDTPEVDIAGCNLYQKYIDRLRQRRHDKTGSGEVPPKADNPLPGCRNVPEDATFHPQTVDRVVPLLVCTGVYRPELEQDNGKEEQDGKYHHGHRDFPKSAELDKPAKICLDVEGAIDYILEIENFYC